MGSATFLGAQHRFTVQLEGDDAQTRATRLVRTLPEAEWAIAGHVVADIVVDALRTDVSGVVFIDLAMLTVEDW